MNFQVQANRKETTKHQMSGYPLAIYHKTLVKKSGDELIIHWHDEFQLLWIVKGVSEYRVNQQKIELQPGMLLFINSKKLHQARPFSDSVEYISINFEQGLFTQRFYQDYFEAICLNKTLDYQLIVPELQVLKKMEDAKIKKQQILLAHQIILLALGEIALPEMNATNFSNELVQTILADIHESYSTDLTVNGLCKKFGLNKNKLTELFIAYTNLAPKQYVVDYRLKKARQLLLQTEQSVSAICEQVGFRHFSHFSNSFKKRYQLTPLKFRQQFKK